MSGCLPTAPKCGDRQLQRNDFRSSHRIPGYHNGYATAAIIMNLPSLDKFEECGVPGGMVIVNSSLIPKKVTRQDVKAYYVPANEIALGLGKR